MTDLEVRLAEIRQQYKPGVNEAVDYLLNRIADRDFRIEGLLGRLRALEWIGGPIHQRIGRVTSACPVCETELSRDGTHAPDCWLAAELRP